jgi:nucleoid DNA-binding protein
VNKHDLSKAVYNVHGGLSYAESQKVVEAIFEIIKARLLQGEKVLISGFGCFQVVARQERRGVNPQTSTPIIIPGRRAISFKPAKRMKSL